MTPLVTDPMNEVFKQTGEHQVFSALCQSLQSTFLSKP